MLCIGRRSPPNNANRFSVLLYRKEKIDFLFPVYMIILYTIALMAPQNALK